MRTEPYDLPTGARYVALCFSAASIKTVKTSREVRNISRKTPRVTVTPLPSVVLTANGPGKIADTTPAAAMPASICDMKQRMAREGEMDPTRYSPKVT